MKKYLFVLISAALVCASAACSRLEGDPVSTDQTIIHATYAPLEYESSPQQVSSPATRTQLDADGHTYYWSTGDEIALFSSTDWTSTMPSRNLFSLIGGNGTASATFQMDGSPSGTCRYAVYPYRYVNSNNGTKSGWMYITLPTVQDGSISNAISLANDDKETGTWSFVNVSSTVKMTVSKDDHIRGITIRFDNPVTGKMIAAGGGSRLTTNSSNSPDNNTVTVNAGSDLDGDIYFTIYPIDAGDVTITFTNASSQVATVNGHTTKPFAKGKIKNFGPFTVANGLDFVAAP